MKIVLDIGHAHGTGARGNGLEEHSIVSFLAEILAPILRKQGHEVTVIDFPDMNNAGDLSSTIKAANSGNFDIGISLHCDCSDNPAARGAHVCYLSSKGHQLAKAIAKPLSTLLPGRAESVVKRDNLAVLKQTRPVWALCECGFISHPGDAHIMRDTPEKIAKAIAEGVQNYSR